jgi:hypothetical protein
MPLASAMMCVGCFILCLSLEYLMNFWGNACRLLCGVAVGAMVCIGTCRAANEEELHKTRIREFVASSCLDCHAGIGAEADLDLKLLSFDLKRREVYEQWELIHDRIRDGEMPPPDKAPEAIAEIGWSSSVDEGLDLPKDEDHVESLQVLRSLATLLTSEDRRRRQTNGRAQVRRLNRFEYENALRAVLDAPWLRIADSLPEDGMQHLFAKSGERLDVSHVQLQRLMSTSQQAIRLAIDAAAYPCQTRKFYARQEPEHQNYYHYRFGQTAATRSMVPLLGWQSEPDVIRKKQDMTVGAADPERRELEASGVFCGVYGATTKYDFSRVKTPIDGLYQLRFKTYTFMAGPNGASGGDDHGLTGGRRAWWRPDRNVIFKSKRSEPVTLYALSPGGDSRWLTTFDSLPEPSIFEGVVALRAGENIRPDASRLVRTRPGWAGNPNATHEGVPGFAMNWLEVTGPLSDCWPPPSYQAVLGDLPFQVSEDSHVRVASVNPEIDAHRLLQRFARRLTSGASLSVDPYMQIFRSAMALEYGFTESLIAATAAMLCSPEFLYLESTPGPLSEQAFRERLAYFLWNGPPTAQWLPTRLTDGDANQLAETVDRMLDDPRSNRFVNSLLDYWLDLRDLNTNTPDAVLYPDYYLDEALTETSLLETRLFFRELIDKNLPVSSLITADFAFVNERLAEHYALPHVEGVRMRRVDLPADSVRGGLLTQASIMRVTANGTTTSPVVRGAWISERLLGIEIPPPPSGVDAIEPDTRGATTVREQLEQHRSSASCQACHAKFDAVGFGLESFDVAGGWRDQYRAIGDQGEPVEGFGVNGHKFEFKLAQPVDCTGELRCGAIFDDVRDLKRLLASNQRALARNLLRRLIVYATGAEASFADRAEVEDILDRAAADDFGVRSLIHGLVQSSMFAHR